MKKTYLLLFALVVLAVPFSAHAQYYDQYITDGSFVNGGASWTEVGTITYKQITNPCSPFSPNPYVAEINNSSSISQTFTVSGNYSTYSLGVWVFLFDDTDNFYDQLRMTVKNNTTNQTEVFYLRGSSFDFDCGPQYFNLSNQYDNASVTVTLDVSYLNLATWDIDAVAFFANY